MEQLTASQLAEWEEYSKIDPIGMWRQDYHLAYLLTTISNLAIGIHGKKGTQLHSVDDFLIKWDSGPEENRVQTVEEMKQVLMGMAKTVNKQHNKTLKK